MRTPIVLITCDVTGDPDAQGLTFTFDGTEYEIDLCTEQMAAMRAAIGPYIEVARRTGGKWVPGKTPGKAKTSSPREKKSRTLPAPGNVIRAWAQGAGVECNNRGRIPDDVILAYTAARVLTDSPREPVPEGERVSSGGKTTRSGTVVSRVQPPAPAVKAPAKPRARKQSPEPVNFTA